MLEKNPVLGPGRDPPSCNITIMNRKKKKNWMTSLLREPAAAFTWGPLIILTEALALDQEDAAAEEPAELLVVVEIVRKTTESRSSAHN